MKMMQGDSFAVAVSIMQDGIVLTDYDVADVEICVGETIRKTKSAGEVWFDKDQQLWYFRLSQSETLDIDGSVEAVVRVKYRNSPNPDVIGQRAGIINVQDTISKEVI